MTILNLVHPDIIGEILQCHRREDMYYLSRIASMHHSKKVLEHIWWWRKETKDGGKVAKQPWQLLGWQVRRSTVTKSMVRMSYTVTKKCRIHIWVKGMIVATCWVSRTPYNYDVTWIPFFIVKVVQYFYYTRFICIESGVLSNKNWNYIKQ